MMIDFLWGLLCVRPVRAEDVEYAFAIVLKATGKVIGEIDAHPDAPSQYGGKLCEGHLQPLLDAESRLPRQRLRL